MRTILFIHHGIGIGGASTSLLQMVQQLQQNKTLNIKLVFTESSQATTWYKSKGITINETLEIPAFSHTVIWWYSWYRMHHLFIAFFGVFKTFYKARKIILQHKPDIIHLNSTPAWPWALIAKLYGVQVVCHVREPLATGYIGLRRYFLIWWLKIFTDKILAISKFDGAPFACSNKLFVLYNAVDPERFNINLLEKSQELPAATNINNAMCKKKTIFLYLGGASQEKGSLFLLQIWKKLLENNPCATLWIAGSWISTEKSTSFFMNFARRVGIKTPQQKFFSKLDNLIYTLDHSVKIWGLQNKIELLIAQADILLFPCQVGHFARPVLEAAFLKKPSLASQLKPLDELIINHKTGFLLPANNINAWAECMLELINNPAKRQTMGLQAYKRAQHKFSLVKQIEDLKKVYAKLKPNL